LHNPAQETTMLCFLKTLLVIMLIQIVLEMQVLKLQQQCWSGLWHHFYWQIVT